MCMFSYENITQLKNIIHTTLYIKYSQPTYLTEFFYWHNQLRYKIRQINPKKRTNLRSVRNRSMQRI